MTTNMEEQEINMKEQGMQIEQDTLDSQPVSYDRVILGVGLAIIAIGILGVLVWPSLNNRFNLITQESESNTANAIANNDTATNGVVDDTIAAEDSPENLFQLGEQFFKAGQWDEAIDAYEKAVSLKADYDAAYTNLGSAYYRQGDLNAAIDAYEKALSIASNDADTHHNLGMVYLQRWLTETPSNQEFLDNALEQINQAISLDPTLAAPYYGLGVIYQNQNEIAKAIEAYEKFLELDDGADPKATNNATQILQQLKAQ